MEINRIYNQDCFDTMSDMLNDGLKVDVILTSPPYCTDEDDARKYTDKKFNNYNVHYDVFTGFDSPEHYRDWTIRLFNSYNDVLNENGVVLYNISYTKKKSDLVYLVISDIIKNTEFTVVDCISWKKNSALPQNQNPNRLTRVCEFVFVLCRKAEVDTFHMNKEKDGTKYKNLFTNFIEAPNNDILDMNINRLNSATFSTLFVLQLLERYAKEDSIVYDSFMGTGTVAVGCKRFGCNYIGSELSKAQCEFAELRIKDGVNGLKFKHRKRLF